MENNYDSFFTFGFCSIWQASLLYTLVIRHAELELTVPLHTSSLLMGFFAHKSLASSIKAYYQPLSWKKNYHWHESVTGCYYANISATGLINISLRDPKCIKKRKLDTYRKGTAMGYYLSFFKATLDEMDKHPEMKEHYLVRNNVPVHSLTDIGKCIHSRGYQYVYLPPYSPELNPIK